MEIFFKVDMLPTKCLSLCKGDHNACNDKIYNSYPVSI